MLDNLISARSLRQVLSGVLHHGAHGVFVQHRSSYGGEAVGELIMQVFSLRDSLTHGKVQVALRRCWFWFHLKLDVAIQSLLFRFVDR